MPLIIENLLHCTMMHVVCCVGESVCATSHLPCVLPCRVAAWVRNTHCTDMIKEPGMHLLAKRCKEMYGKPRKKLIVVFELLVTPLKQPLASFLVHMEPSTHLGPNLPSGIPPSHRRRHCLKDCFASRFLMSERKDAQRRSVLLLRSISELHSEEIP